MTLLSVIMPGIRPRKWEKVDESIEESLDGTNYELIICSPYQLPGHMDSKFKVKYVKDYGCPTRASNIAASLAEGDLIFWTADDGLFRPGALKKLILESGLLQSGICLKKVITAKYTEGGNSQPNSYFKMGNAYPRTPMIDPDWWIFNVGLMRTSYFNYLGGWDCGFQACPLAHADMAIRAYRDGADVQFSEDEILDCEHMPGSSGDHGPIFVAQTYEDTPKFIAKHSQACPGRIDMDNWKQAEPIWSKRFKKNVKTTS